MPRIYSVIVTYEPNLILLTRLLDALVPQVTGGVIINNGRALLLTDEYLRQTGFSVIHLQSNTGVATALNAGVEWAEKQDAEYVITFDQDSEPAFNMISNLLRDYYALVGVGQKVGAIGPQQIDRRTGRHSVFIAPILGRRRRITPDPGKTIEVDHLITSGCMAPIEVWRNVGKFLDPLFIDYVDIEWSLRLRHAGWHLFGSADAKLLHSIGDDVKKFGSTKILWHSSLRHYFIFRNGIYLQKLPYIPLRWKISDGLQLLKKFILFTIAGRPRLAHMLAMLRGMRDGYKGKLGPASNYCQ